MLDIVLAVVLLPSNSSELAAYYLFWISLYLIVNVIWDVKTKRTPAFHLDRFKEKGDVLFSASSFCSSLLILVGLLSPTVRQLGKDTIVPLALAGFSGLIRAVPAICPYKSTDPLKED
ncbi:hypothetical protein AB7M17_005253 [Bradyrhizobium sp. USDA 377]